MKRFDVKEYTSKYMEFAKIAGSGAYPNKKIAKIGSMVGLGLGGVLFCAGIYGLTKGTIYGIGSLAVGLLTTASNAINLKRIR